MTIRALWLAAALAAVAGMSATAQDLQLEGTVTGAAHESYVSVPFQVPPGTHSFTVTFAYDKADGAVIDLGVFGPDGFRGWSGGNKSAFTIGAADASPSYLTGVEPGQWTLLLGVPNARPDSATSWQAAIDFADADTPPAGFTVQPLEDGARWYRGDLHAHTAHSDGGCATQSGKRAPCPLYRSVKAAADRGLDFLSITDHNTVSQFAEMRGLQPAYDQLLLIPGREITTFQGHANLFGPTQPLDFRLGSESVPDIGALLKDADALGGVFSVNHPGLPSGEACMGCGWTAEPTDWSAVDAIEVANGGVAAAADGAFESPLSGIPFWEALLNQGHRLTGIGGSDNHDALIPAGDPRAIGGVVTAIHAKALSVPALLSGLRDGRVFIDLRGRTDSHLELMALTRDNRAFMGESVSVNGPSAIDFDVTLNGCQPCQVDVVHNGASVRRLARAGRFTLPDIAPGDWVRINARDDRGRLVMIGNPIYFE